MWREVERAISAAGHVVVTLPMLPAADQTPAQLCMDRVRGCEVYVGVLGTPAPALRCRISRRCRIRSWSSTLPPRRA